MANKQHILKPIDLNFNGRTVAATATTSTVFGVGGYNQLSFAMAVTRVDATAWTVYFEYSPDYEEVGAASATWIRVQVEDVGAVAAGAATITLGDGTWSFTTSTTDTLSIELPINYHNMRFVVNNTAGSTDTAKAWITLGGV